VRRKNTNGQARHDVALYQLHTRMHHQRGQVIPLGVVLVVVVLIASQVMFNTGQVAKKKMLLGNAADAAAYSGALWQARALNFQAYTNRAMVANQVSIAQSVALKSFASYGAVASENVATVLKPIPVINVISTGVETGFATLNQVIEPLVKSIVPMVSLVTQGLSRAQSAMHASAVVATSSVIEEITKHSDPDFTIRTGFNAQSLAKNLNQWQGFTTRFSTDYVEGMRSKQRMVNESLDDFSRQRNWEFFKFWFHSSALLRHKVIRRGATRLNSTHDAYGLRFQWQSEDTVSLHNKISRIGGSKRVEIPIGWASAVAGSNTELSGSAVIRCVGPDDAYCQSLTATNKRASEWAQQGVLSPAKALQTQSMMAGYTGLQPYRSLSQSSRQHRDPRLALKVEVASQATQLNDTSKAGFDGTFELPVAAAANQLSSVSAAEIYFHQPGGNTLSSAQRAHGYSPYWQVRLTPVSLQDRQLALTLRGTVATTTKESSNFSHDGQAIRHQFGQNAAAGMRIDDGKTITVDAHNDGHFARRSYSEQSTLTHPSTATISSMRDQQHMLVYYESLKHSVTQTLSGISDNNFQQPFAHVLDTAKSLDNRWLHSE